MRRQIVVNASSHQTVLVSGNQSTSMSGTCHNLPCRACHCQPSVHTDSCLYVHRQQIAVNVASRTTDMLFSGIEATCIPGICHNLGVTLPALTLAEFLQFARLEIAVKVADHRHEAHSRWLGMTSSGGRVQMYPQPRTSWFTAGNQSRLHAAAIRG